MEEKKKGKKRYDLWLCCSAIKVKSKKENCNEEKSNGKPVAAEQKISTSSLLFSGPNNNNSINSACLCCSVIEDGTPPPSPLQKSHQSSFEADTKKGTIAVVNPPDEDIFKQFYGQKYCTRGPGN
ncbi:hypothetical protein ACH5RR_040358 [Cinchona calisaya]|uniref:Uncharacterized protein n=1 Tax=Cinchona calisaya TaxID=153742 RepID=A0ABD2XSU2_9GENT